MDHILAMLRTLEQLEAQYTLRRAAYDQAKEEAIPESVRAQLAAIDAAYQPELDGMAVEIEQLKQCKASACAYGRTVKGGGFICNLCGGAGVVGQCLPARLRRLASRDSARLQGRAAVCDFAQR